MSTWNQGGMLYQVSVAFIVPSIQSSSGIQRVLINVRYLIYSNKFYKCCGFLKHFILPCHWWYFVMFTSWVTYYRLLNFLLMYTSRPRKDAYNIYQPPAFLGLVFYLFLKKWLYKFHRRMKLYFLLIATVCLFFSCAEKSVEIPGTLPTSSGGSGAVTLRFICHFTLN